MLWCNWSFSPKNSLHEKKITTMWFFSALSICTKVFLAKSTWTFSHQIPLLPLLKHLLSCCAVLFVFIALFRTAIASAVIMVLKWLSTFCPTPLLKRKKTSLMLKTKLEIKYLLTTGENPSALEWAFNVLQIVFA